MAGSDVLQQTTRLVLSRLVLSMICILCWCGALGFAQSSSQGSSVTGRVTDPKGLAVPEALLTLRSILTGAELSSGTASDGTFAFPAVAAGAYELTVTARGLAADSRRLTVTAGAAQATGDIQLSLAGSREQVTVVSGSRLNEAEDESPTKVLAVTRQEIQDTGYERLGDVLSEVPGVVTRAQSFGVGITAGEQIDGIDSKETLVLMDGLPLAGARGITGGFIDLNQQSIGPLEQVEVVKGAASALYGTDALGGVINLITREPAQPFTFDASLSGGSLGALDGRFDLGGKWKNLTGFLDMGSHHLDSYSLIPNDPTTTGAEEDRQDILAKLRYTFSPRAAVGFTTTAYREHQYGIGDTFGVDPSNPYAPSPTALRSNDSTQTYALTGDFMPSPTTTLQTRLYTSRFVQDSGSNIIGGNGAEGAQFDLGNLREDYLRGDTTLSQQIGRWNFLQGGYEWVQDRYRGDNRIVGGGAGQQLTTNDLWLEDRIQPFRNLTVTLGGRFQDNSSYGGHVVPKAGAVYRVNDHLVLRASFGLGFRAPNLGELYYHLLHLEYGYQVIGNPTLRPETSQSFSSGATYSGGRYRLSLNLFHNNLKNLIDNSLVCNATGGQDCSGAALETLLGQYGVPGNFEYDTSGSALFTFINVNIDRAMTRGFDVDGSVALSPSFTLSGAYTYLDAVNLIDHTWLANRNRHQGHVKLEYSRPRWGLLANLRGTFQSKWPTTTSDGTSAADYAYGYQIWNFYASKTLRGGLQAFGAIDNLADSTDRKLSDSTPSFDRPDYGRTFRVGLRYSFAAERN